MELDEILLALDAPPPDFPEAALREAEQLGDQITEGLLGLIARARQRAQEGTLGDGNGHIFAMLLLAKIEEERAFSGVMELLGLPTPMVEDLLGDFLTTDLGRVLASLSGGQIERLAAVVEDGMLAPYVRVAGLGGIVALVARDVIQRDQAAAYLTSLVQSDFFTDAPDELAYEVAGTVLNLHVEDLFGDVRSAIRGGRLKPPLMSLKDVYLAEQEGSAAALAQLKEASYLRPVIDAVAETSWWAMYHEGEDDHSCHDPDCSEDHQMPVVRDAPKVGRNDPCPCGSGKKFKKCCQSAVS